MFSFALFWGCCFSLSASEAWQDGETVVAKAKSKDASKKEPPSADQIMESAGRTLFPEEFSAQIEMVQHKPGQENIVSRLMLYKKDQDHVRADYIYPPLQAGQKMLRREGQIWMYMPDTKRAIRLSPKQSLGGSDFNNGDIMRLDLEEDYTPRILEESDTHWVLELKARDRTVTYDVIKYTIRKEGMRSVKMEYYTLSGKLIKTLEFKEYKDYDGLLRPSLFVMSSNLTNGVYTDLHYLQFEKGKSLPASQFRPDAMSKQ